MLVHTRIKEEAVLAILQLDRITKIEGTEFLLSTYFPTLNKVAVIGIKHIEGEENNFSNIISSGFNEAPITSTHQIYNEWIKFTYIFKSRPKVFEKRKVIPLTLEEMKVKVILSRKRPFLPKEKATNTPKDNNNKIVDPVKPRFQWQQSRLRTWLTPPDLSKIEEEKKEVTPRKRMRTRSSPIHNKTTNKVTKDHIIDCKTAPQTNGKPNNPVLIVDGTDNNLEL